MGRPHGGGAAPLRGRGEPGHGRLRSIGLTLYGALRRVVRPLLRVVFGLDVAGTEHVPPHGAVVVVANHLSALDPFVLGAAVPRDLHFMAKEELWRWRPLGWAVEQLGGFPVARGRSDREAVERAVDLLRAGHAVALFPEGRVRTEGAWRRGAARLALATGAPIVPVRLFGTDRALAGRRVRITRLRVAIGPPIAVTAEAPTLDGAQSLTESVRAAVQALRDPTT